MAAVVKSLFGKHPEFIKIKSRKNLWELIQHLPSYGIGLKVSPSEWYRQGRTLNYYKIEKVSPAYKQVWAVRYRQGRKASLPYLIAPGKFKTWGFFHTPERIARIKKSLSLSKE